MTDDVVIFPFNIPHQAMAVVELNELANLLNTIKMRPDLAAEASSRAQTIETALWKWGVVNTQDYGEVFAYEIDGNVFQVMPGNQLKMIVRLW